MLKKWIFTVIIIIILLLILIFVAYSNQNSNIQISLNNESYSFSDSEELYFSEDVTLNWDNNHYKVYSNDEEIDNNTIFNQTGTYDINFEFHGKEIKNLKLVIDKETTTKIVDYDGNEIHNYASNKLPFVIEDDNEILVNGEPYDKSRGIYSIGNYKITNNQGKNINVNINNIDKNKEYDFYITSATLSTLYSALNLADDSSHSYVWFGRADTMDIVYLRKHNITVSDYVGNNLALIEDVVPEAVNLIKEILHEDPDAYFNLYVDDNRHYLEYMLFAEQGLDEHRYSVNYFSDGTLSYVQSYSYNEYDPETDTITSDLDKFIQVQEEQNSILDNARANKYKDDDYEYILTNQTNELEYQIDYILVSTLRNNVTYYLQYPEFLKIGNEIKPYLENANIEELTPTEMFANLSDNEKRTFFNYIGLDKSDLDKQYFNSDNNKKYLVITGTTPIDNNLGKENFEDLIDKVVEEYGDDYNILYKPHPSAVPDEEYLEYFSSKNIKVLPERLPMEAILFVYPEIKLGGFASSLYMSVPNNQSTLFFFGNNKDDLFSPLDILYDDLFQNSKFIN